MPTRSDDEFLDLIRRAIAGCNDAVTILIEEYREALLTVIRKMLPKRALLRRQFDSHDFLQEIFFEAFAGKLADKSFQSPQAFARYLKVIAENRLRDTVRKKLLAQRSSFSHEVSLNASSTAGEPISKDHATADLEREVERARVAKSVARLPLVHRVILKDWLSGARPAEIAEKLNLDVAQIYQCLESAKRTVRSDLQGAANSAIVEQPRRCQP